MRATLADARLLGYAGRFVWLALDFDRPDNAAFFARHGVAFTPTFYILDPSDEHAIATHMGAMTVDEVAAFLDLAARPPATAAGDIALARGDALLAADRRADAADAYTDAVRLGAGDRAVASLTRTLQLEGRKEACAEVAAREAPRVSRRELGRVVVVGLACTQDATAMWASSARAVLEPLAVDALANPALDRDVRFALYRALIVGAPTHAVAATWGDRWFAEIDAIAPRDDDDRMSLDIARVEAARELDDPARAIPALVASERALPTSYVPSLRLAQLDLDAKRYADAVDACDRGLARATGPLARAWLREMQASALVELGRRREARLVLEQALRDARDIPLAASRDRNIATITKALDATAP